jgi:hypothetical protein
MTMTFDKAQTWRKISDQPGNYYCQANEKEREYFRGFIKGLMGEKQITIEFEKADGTPREMICTLSEQHGAKYAVNESVPGTEQKTRKQNSDVCVAWDCELKAWRSFRWDRLKRIEFKLG